MGQPLTKFPRLVREWDLDRNIGLRPEDVTSGSDKAIWWCCSVDRSHRWQAAPCMRTRGVGCPFCSGRRATRENCLAVVEPEVASEFHPTRNGDLTPYDVTPASNRTVWWKCPKGPDHEWQATVTTRTQQRTRCPFCAGRRASVTNSLANMAPSVAAQWHPEKNGTLSPHEESATAWRLRWWKCSEGPDHEWEDYVWNRTRKTGGCPFCGGRRVSVTNSLASLEPDVAALWHPTKNGPATPSDVTAGSAKRVWWKCPQGPDHEWRVSVANCVHGSIRCPFCANKRVSITNALAHVCPAIAAEWHPTKNGDVTAADVVSSSNERVWWQCASGHDWKTRIAHRTGLGSGCPTCFTLQQRGRRPLTRKVLQRRVRLPER